MYEAVQRRLEEDGGFVSCRRICDGKMRASGVIIGRWLSFVAITKQVTVRHFTVDGIVVWRWRFLPTLVPDDEALAAASSRGKAWVFRASGSSAEAPNWRGRSELLCPDFVPRAIVDGAREVAEAIAAAAVKTRQARVIVSGPIGCGKSTTSRLLAAAIGRVTGDESAVSLVAGFDPSRPGHSLAGVLDLAQFADNHWVVVMLDEVDCVLSKLDSAVGDANTPPNSGAAPIVGSGKNGVLPEVVDKGTWNAMLDMLQFYDRVILVMTTNLSFSELDAIDAPHRGALLRAGRVTMRVEMHEDGSHRVVQRGSECRGDVLSTPSISDGE